ncbi:MAG: hybrid sensor histidine kinase/response regulator [Planctomycetota bacterium]|jgi:PAS domain S-box-containing protein
MALTLFSAKEGDILGKPVLEFVHPDDRDVARQRIQRLTESGGVAEPIDEKFLALDGRVMDVVVSGIPIESFEGKPATMVVFQDVTEQKRAQEVLERERRRFISVFEALHAYIVLIAPDHSIHFANRFFRDTFGDPEGKKCYQVFVEGDHPCNLCRSFGTLETGKPGQWEWTDPKRGNTYRIYSYPFASEEGAPLILEMGIDITDSKFAEKALKESEGRYRLLFENSPIGISVVDLETRKALYVNPAFCTMLGYTEGEFKSMPFHTLTRDDAQKGVIERFGKLEEGTSTFATSTPFLRKDGTVVYINCNAGPARVDGRPCSIGFHVDVTEVMTVMEERRKFHQQMQQTQKLESLGVLAGGIAHDFNNLLTGVLGNADLARMELDTDHPARPFIHHVETATRRLADLTNQMLAYSGRGQFVVEPLHLSNLVEEMGRLLEISISKDVDLVYEVEADLPLIKADPTQIRQVIMNLITNASEALEDRPGRIVARTGAVEADRKILGETVLGEALPEGSYVFLEVSDTGRGMDAETCAKIFDPFYTTKFTGRGLGLAAVLGIVRSHGGAIRLDSEPGQGTTFRVLLPATPETRDSTRKRVRTGEWLGSGTILVIDDEKAVRLVAKDMLEKAGFTVLTAGGGKEGLERFQEHRKTIRAVLLDLTMPKMGGEETFMAIRRLQPDVPVILFSGYTERDATRRFAGKGLSGFVQKPFDSRRLIRPLRAVLEGGGE